jgi:hypothetical protein
MRRLESDNSSSRGETYSFSASRTGENSNFSWSSSMNVGQTSTGELTERISHRANYSRPLTEKISSSLGVTYTEFRSPSDENDQKTESISFSPSLQWQVTERLGISLSYSFRRVTDFEDDSKSRSNSISVSISYPFNGYSISR